MEKKSNQTMNVKIKLKDIDRIMWKMTKTQWNWWKLKMKKHCEHIKSKHISSVPDETFLFLEKLFEKML